MIILFIIGWLLIGVVASALMLWSDLKNTGTLTLGDLFGVGVVVLLLGPIAVIGLTFSFLEDHSDTVIIRRKPQQDLEEELKHLRAEVEKLTK